MTRDRVIIVDIDGTVALRRDRSPYDESRVHRDAPNRNIIDVIDRLATTVPVIFLSGRTEAARADTRRWLTRYLECGAESALYMRAIGDRRNDAIVKEELYRRHIEPRNDVLCVFDDRDRVVAMWRRIGLTCLQVAYGDF